ncbi:hypothetical protein FRZ44_21200 [Hypericibacter terrae]|uniref:Uncharacterized protein n=1 Tax=Hypericibacter terrae TaxID=2602015 RepID=A0A5J6MK08_9PROT|nr:hypothetical protein FRZ44_21200 [Hypericibacter terrae]
MGPRKRAYRAAGRDRRGGPESSGGLEPGWSGRHLGNRDKQGTNDQGEVGRSGAATGMAERSAEAGPGHGDGRGIAGFVGPGGGLFFLERRAAAGEHDGNGAREHDSNGTRSHQFQYRQ